MATTVIYTLSLHDALPILVIVRFREITFAQKQRVEAFAPAKLEFLVQDRKSTRLNSSHTVISYAVFCLKKKRSRRAMGGPGMGSTPTRQVVGSRAAQGTI